MWGAGAARACVQLTPLEALLFGSMVSATDPVSVLAVFQRLGADPDLFALVSEALQGVGQTALPW